VSHIPWKPLNDARPYGVHYALGAVVNRYHGIERLDRAGTATLVLAATVGFGLVSAAVFNSYQENPLLKPVVAFCGIAASVAVAIMLSRIGGWGFVRVLGFYSLEIYVAHTIASASLRILLRKVLRLEEPALHIIIGTLGGIVLPLILVRLCHRFHTEWLFRMTTRKPAM